MSNEQCRHEFVGGARECAHCGWRPDPHLSRESLRIVAEQRAEIERLTRELDEMRAATARVAEWCRQYGASLKPQGADTYGNGMRTAKAQVGGLLLGAGRRSREAEVCQLTRERDDARAEVKRLRRLLSKHAAELVRGRYSRNGWHVAEQIKTNKRALIEGLDKDHESQRLAGIALNDALQAVDKALEGKSK